MTLHIEEDYKKKNNYINQMYVSFCHKKVYYYKYFNNYFIFKTLT